MGIRTFIAIEVPEEIQARLRELQDEWKKERAKVTWVKPGNIHLTLKFLGDVPEDKMELVQQGVKRATEGLTSFTMAVKNVGAFPSLTRPRVLWVGIEEPTGKVNLLASRIEDEMTKLGFEKENRPFSPHLTLGRVKIPTGAERLAEKVEATSFDAGEFVVNEVVVMRSDLKPTGAVYTPLKRFALSQ